MAGDESDVPRNLHNIVVSIHAIATFQALHDYLRPRVAGLLNSGSRLSGMLAALAASGFTGSGSRPDGVPQPPQLPPAPMTDGGAEPLKTPGPTSSLGRRRSQRLSAKNAGTTVSDDAAVATDEPPSEVEVTRPISDPAQPEGSAIPALPAEAAPSETLVDSDLQAEFTDDEVDAEVFDEDGDPDTSISDKTVMLSVAEGESIVA